MPPTRVCVAGMKRFFAPLLAGLLLVTVGCQKTDPRKEPVQAQSPSALMRWRSMVGTEIKPDEWREFDAMVQEIRLRVTAEKQASGSEAVEAAMRNRINGLSFTDVIALGYEGRLLRVRPERQETLHAMRMNAEGAGQLEGMKLGAEMERMRQAQAKRLSQLDAQIDEAVKRLKALGKYVDAGDPGVTAPQKK